MIDELQPNSRPKSACWQQHSQIKTRLLETSLVDQVEAGRRFALVWFVLPCWAPLELGCLDRETGAKLLFFPPLLAISVV